MRKFLSNPLLIVLFAGFATGLAAGISPRELLRLLGEFFVANRFMTLPAILLVPAIGLLERYGLQEYAAQFIRRAAATTAGRVLFFYQLLREIPSMFGVNIGGHASMVRPIIAPMAEGAAQARFGALPPALSVEIRAHAAAAENWGNFFADDILVAVGPVLLMKGVFESAGVPVSVWELGLWGLPTAFVAAALGWWRFHTLDRRIAKFAASSRP